VQFDWNAYVSRYSRSIHFRFYIYEWSVKMKSKAIVMLCGASLLLFLAGPSQARHYTKKLFYYDRYSYYVAPPRYSALACDNYAINYARRASEEGEIFGGGAFGSLAGLGIGSLFAASGVGAAIGATAGIIGGGAVRSQREQQIYYAAFYDCMVGIAR
jgi:hypothetical protein